MGELTVELERMVSRCFFGRCMTIESLAPSLRLLASSVTKRANGRQRDPLILNLRC